MPTTTQGGGGGGPTKCQDCGNQAKKECGYSRCRTCCKNKGFHCQTHIKSTWIPVDRKRHRDDLFHAHTSSKRLNHYSYSEASGSGEELKFPAATSSTAIFRCVEVRSVDDTVNEVAYQTSVKIGGRVFSGLLYDQRPAAPPRQTSLLYAPNKGHTTTATTTLDQQHVNNTPHDDGEGAIMAPLSSSSAPTDAPHDHHDPHFLPPPPPPYPFPLSSFRPGSMPYFSYPKS